jgi:hypothetical protein
MKIKANVIMQGLRKCMRPVMIEAERIWRDHGQELVITAALDGTHSAGSLHYYGEALDLRTRYFIDGGEINTVARKLRDALGSEYDVVVHKSHIHVEYDPKY